MSTTPTPPPADKPGFLASLPSWIATVIIAVVSAVIGFGSSKYQQGARDQAWQNKFDTLQKEVTDLRNGPIKEYQDDKRNRQMQDALRLAAFEEAQAREYGRVQRLGDQLQSQLQTTK